MAASKRRRPRGPVRKKDPSRRRILAVLESCVAIAVLLGLSYGFVNFAMTSELFNIKTVTIEGTRVLEPERVLAQSGVDLEDNIFLFDVAGTRARVESMPYVKFCRIERTFPNTINLIVEEREAFAALMIHSRVFEVDKESIVLREYDPTEIPVDPYITNVQGLDFVEVGEKLDVPALVSALSVWSAYSSAEMSAEVTVAELAAFHENDIRMFFDDLPYVIRWGRRDFVNQARRLDILWEAKEGDIGCTDYLDLRFGQDLTCK